MTRHTVIPCDDLDAAVDFLTTRLGFRLDTIAPADDPAVAELTGYGLRLAVERRGSGAVSLLRGGTSPLPPMDPELVVSTAADGAWIQGRAGMRYRDLIPGRLGGRFIASHILIDDGGPVPDYVHFHDVRFQLIYCARGWVEVVYEDQGRPFVLQAGDCVLQPPQIRHRVLRASPSLEVVEVTSPAVHLTRVDHSMALPTGRHQPERSFGGQRFVHHVAAEASWGPWTSAGWEHRDTGICRATGGVAGVRVARPVGVDTTGERHHDGEFAQFVVLDGGATFRSGQVAAPLGPMASVVVPAGLGYTISDVQPGTELLEITLPG